MKIEIFPFQEIAVENLRLKGGRDVKFFDRKERRRYTRMGSWWDRKGENEIDLVCENELTGKLDFYEVKRKADRFNPNALTAKVEAFLRKNPTRRELDGMRSGLSMSDM